MGAMVKMWEAEVCSAVTSESASDRSKRYTAFASSYVPDSVVSELDANTGVGVRAIRYDLGVEFVGYVVKRTLTYTNR